MKRALSILTIAAALTAAPTFAAVTGVDIEDQTVIVNVDGKGYSFALGDSCKKSRLKTDDGSVDFGRDGKYIVIGNFKTRITCGGAGSGSSTQQAGKDTGQSAEEVADEVYGDGMADNVGTIETTAVAATGEGQQAGDTVAAEGLTQSDMTEGATETPPMP